MQNGFEGIDKAMNTNFDSALDDVEKSLDNFNSKKTALVEKSKNGTYTLEDEDS